MTRTRQIMVDAAHTLGTRIGNAALAALLGILTARALGPSERGLYVLPGVVASFMIAACSGLAGATTYFMIKNRLLKLPAVIWTAGLLFSAAGALLTLAIAVWSHQSWAITAATLAVFSSAAISIANGYYYGINRVRSVNALATVSALASLIFIGGSLFLIKKNAHTAIAAWVVAGVLVGVGANIWIAIRGGIVRDASVSLRDYMPFAIKMGAGGLAALLNYRIDTYLVALMTSPKGLGLYTVAVAAAESLLKITQIASAVTLPHIGSLDKQASIDLTARTCRNSLALAVVLCGAVYALAPLVVGILYGGAFLPAVPSLRVLLIGVLALSTGSVLSSYFTIHLGRPYLPLVVALLSAFICLILSIILIPRIGILGGAIGTAVSYFATQLTVMLYFKKITGVPHRELYFLQRSDVVAYRGWIRSALHRKRRRQP